MDPRSDPQRTLRWLRAAAEQVQARLPDVPPGHPAQRVRKEALRLAAELYERAGMPITIGLVGEYGVGKSQLFNALLGLPDLLYVSPAPATGNVTAVRVEALPPGERPGAPAASVTLMARREVADAARYMVGKLVELVNAEELRYDVDALADEYDPVADGFETLERAALAWWGEDRNLALQKQAWELFRLRDALAFGGDLLDDDRASLPIRIKPDLIREAVAIGGARDVPRIFPGPSGRRQVRRGGDLDAVALSQVFPLIRRVTYEVGIDPALWQLGGLRESNGVEFLDFPGLNALGGIRDEYLCRQELKTLTSFVEVLDAKRPEVRTATIFATILQSSRRSSTYLTESVLLAANKFDTISAASLPPGPVTLEELRQDKGEIGSLFRMLGELSEDDWSHVAFTCAEPVAPSPAWGLVAAGLEADGQRAAGEAIRGYLADGGIGRLRDLIADQVNIRALPIEVDELLALRDALRAELAMFRNLLRPLPTGPAGQEAQRRLADLVVALDSAATGLRTSATVFRDPRSIMVDSANVLRGGKVSLLDRIGQSAVLTVYGSQDWVGQWRALFEAVKPQRREIPLRKPAAGDAGGTDQPAKSRRYRSGLDDDDDDDDSPIPVSTKDFRDLYKGSLATLHDTAVKFAREALTEWITGCDRRLSDVRSQMRDPDMQLLLASRLAALDPRDRGARRLRRLNRIIDLAWVPGLFHEALEQFEDIAEHEGPNFFPLASNQALPWNGGFAAAEKDDAGLHMRRHQSTVQRLRYDLAEGLAFPVQNAIATAFGHLAVELDGEFEKLIGGIPMQADLMAAATPERDGGQAEHGAVAVLAELITRLSGPGQHTEQDGSA